MSRRVIKSVHSSTTPYQVTPPQRDNSLVDGSASKTSHPSDIEVTTPFPHRLQAILRGCDRAARAILQDAQREADAIRLSANNERERVFLEAKQQGERAGLSFATKTVLDATVSQRAQAVAAVRDAAEAKQSQYTGLLEKILSQRSSIIASAETELVALGIGIAEQILDEQLHLDRTHVVRLAQRALARFAAGDAVRIRCAPQDHAVFTQHRERLGFDARALDVVADPSLLPGSVIVDTDDGRRVDASIPSQLERVRNALLRDTGLDNFEPLQLAS